MAFRVGGADRSDLRAPDGRDHWVWSVYREIVQPERCVFTRAREDDERLRHRRSTRVSVPFAAQGTIILLTLHHSLIQTLADRDDHTGGWSQCLDRLTACVAGTH